jgi:hypothetical protein
MVRERETVYAVEVSLIVLQGLPDVGPNEMYATARAAMTRYYQSTRPP